MPNIVGANEVGLEPGLPHRAAQLYSATLRSIFLFSSSTQFDPESLRFYSIPRLLACSIGISRRMPSSYASQDLLQRRRFSRTIFF